jgi:hypothetical protein
MGAKGMPRMLSLIASVEFDVASAAGTMGLSGPAGYIDVVGFMGVLNTLVPISEAFEMLFTLGVVYIARLYASKVAGGLLSAGAMGATRGLVR